MSLLGLVRHLAAVERDWRNWIGAGEPLPRLYGERDADSIRPSASRPRSMPRTGERLAKDGISVRELLVHRIEEYARHCGHADLLRECVDGRVGQ